MKALNNQPELLIGLDFYFNAYQELLYDRPVGMSVGVIPWSSIIKWCKINGIYDINEIDSFTRYMRAMEQVDHEAHEQKARK